MDNEVQEAPVAEEVTQEQEVAQEPAQTVETEVEAQEEAVVAETPAESEEESEEEDSVDVSQFVNQQPYQFNQNEEGYVDPNEVAAQIERRILNQMQFQRQEQKQWEKVEKKYPELANDKGLREMVLNQRIANAVQGKESNLVKVADGLMSRISGAKSEGRADAKVSTKVQKAASLETSTANQGEGRPDEVRERIANGDKQATQDLLADWIAKGLI